MGILFQIHRLQCVVPHQCDMVRPDVPWVADDRNVHLLARRVLLPISRCIFLRGGQIFNINQVSCHNLTNVFSQLLQLFHRTTQATPRMLYMGKNYNKLRESENWDPTAQQENLIKNVTCTLKQNAEDSRHRLCLLYGSSHWHWSSRAGQRVWRIQSHIQHRTSLPVSGFHLRDPGYQRKQENSGK